MTTVNELSKKMGISRRTLQYYDRIGLLCPVRSESGYRLFTDDDEARLRQILKCRKSGMKLKSIEIFLDSDQKGKREMLNAHEKELIDEIEAIKTQLEETRELQRKIENAY